MNGVCLTLRKTEQPQEHLTLKNICNKCLLARVFRSAHTVGFGGNLLYLVDVINSVSRSVCWSLAVFENVRATKPKRSPPISATPYLILKRSPPRSRVSFKRTSLTEPYIWIAQSRNKGLAHESPRERIRLVSASRTL